LIRKSELFVNNFKQKNQLVKLFKYVLDGLQNDNFMVVIETVKVTVGEKARGFIASTVN